MEVSFLYLLQSGMMLMPVDYVKLYKYREITKNYTKWRTQKFCILIRQIAKICSRNPQEDNKRETKKLEREETENKW